MEIKLCEHTNCFRYFKLEPFSKKKFCSDACRSAAYKWRRARVNVVKWQDANCPTPHKKIRIEDKSEMRMYVIKRRYQVKPYYCQCGLWHVSTPRGRIDRLLIKQIFGVTPRGQVYSKRLGTSG